jgi:hypothetical protein
MSLLHPIEAQAKYPDAWRRIEADMEEMKQATAGEFVPVAAGLSVVNGEEVLEVAALTDFIGESDEGFPATMSFTARLAPS